MSLALDTLELEREDARAFWLRRYKPWKRWKVRQGVHLCTIHMEDGRELRARVYYRIDDVWVIEVHYSGSSRHHYRHLVSENLRTNRKLTPRDWGYVKERAEQDLSYWGAGQGHAPWSKPVENTRHTAFKAHMVSDAKRLVRAQLYADVRELLYRRNCGVEEPTVLMLPGGDAVGEIHTARHFLGRCHITAFDRDERALASARQAGADDLIFGDIDNITRWHEHECLRNHGFHFVNLDLCSILSYDTRTVIKRAGHLTQTMAVFVAYGREDRQEMTEILNCGQLHKEVHFPRASEADRTEWKELIDLPTHILGRVLRIWSAVNQGVPDLPIHSVYLYRGNRFPMLGVLMSGRHYSFKHDFDLIRVYRFGNADLRPAVLAYADAHGVEAAAAAYAVKPTTIAAWKAVRTRGQAEAPTEPRLSLVPPEEPTQ
jgi:hypothetical protein